MGKKKKNENGFLLQGSILAIAGIITKLIGVAYRIPLINIMGDKGQGYYNVAFQIYAIALLLTSYSLPLAVSKLVSARIARGERRNAFRVFKGAMVFAITSGTLAAVIVFFGADFIAKDIMYMDLSAYALRVLAPGLVIVAIMGVMRGYFQGTGTMFPTAVSQIIEQIINAGVSIGGAIVLYKMGKEAAKTQGVSSLAEAYAAAGGTLGTVAGALAGLFFLIFVYCIYRKRNRRMLKRDHSKYREDYTDIFKILVLTITPVILSTAVYNISSVIDNAMFNRIMSVQGHSSDECATLLGMFGGKYDTLFNVPLAIANALASSLIPSLVAAVQGGNRKLIHNKIHTVIRFTMIIAIPCAVGFLALGEPLMNLLYTGDNTIPGIMMRIGSVSVIFYCLSTVTNAVLQGLNHMTTPVKNASISLVIHLISLFFMLVVCKWGVYALVASKIVFSLSMCILNGRALRKMSKYIQEKQKTFVIPGLAAVLMGVITFGSHMVLDILIGGRIATLIALVIAVIAYAICLLALGGLSEDDILSFPKGATLVTIFRKLHLLKEEYY